jgi:hypothetical protein
VYPSEPRQLEAVECVSVSSTRRGPLLPEMRTITTIGVIHAVVDGDALEVHRLLLMLNDGDDEGGYGYAADRDREHASRLYDVTSSQRQHPYHPGSYGSDHKTWVPSWSCCKGTPAADTLGCSHRDIPQSIVITAAEMGHLDIAHDLLHSGASLVPDGCESVEVSCGCVGLCSHIRIHACNHLKMFLSLLLIEMVPYDMI